jgi:hypothetical protein
MALLGAKRIGVLDCTGSVELLAPDALATNAPTTIAAKKIIPKSTIEVEDCFIKSKPRCVFEYSYFRGLSEVAIQYISTSMRGTMVLTKFTFSHLISLQSLRRGFLWQK